MVSTIMTRRYGYKCQKLIESKGARFILVIGLSAVSLKNSVEPLIRSFPIFNARNRFPIAAAASYSLGFKMVKSYHFYDPAGALTFAIQITAFVFLPSIFQNSKLFRCLPFKRAKMWSYKNIRFTRYHLLMIAQSLQTSTYYRHRS